MNMCKDCASWQQYSAADLYGWCARMPDSYLPPDTQPLAYVSVSDYDEFASFLTRPDFGCTLFREKCEGE